MADEFTSDDLVAVTMLSTNLSGQAALRILGDRDLDYRAGPSELLRQILTDVELIDASNEVLETAEELWRRIRENHDFGRTKTSKLLARKRLHMLPVIDSVVTEVVGNVPGMHSFYRNLRAALDADTANCTTI